MTVFELMFIGFVAGVIAFACFKVERYVLVNHYPHLLSTLGHNPVLNFPTVEVYDLYVKGLEEALNNHKANVAAIKERQGNGNGSV